MENQIQSKKHIILSLEEFIGKPKFSISEEFEKMENKISEKGRYKYLFNDENENNYEKEKKFIYAYTQEGYLYKFLNERLRHYGSCLNSNSHYDTEGFPIQYFYRLYSSLKRLAFKKNFTDELLCYRGQRRGDTIFENIENQNFFMLYSFWSATKNKKIENQFIKNGGNFIFFVIHCRKRDISGFHSYVDITKFSSFPAEEEIIMPPLTLFEIIEI